MDSEKIQIVKLIIGAVIASLCLILVGILAVLGKLAENPELVMTLVLGALAAGGLSVHGAYKKTPQA